VKFAPVLTFWLQRLKNDRKICDMVYFPVVLHTKELSQDPAVEDATYDLVGYVRHSGSLDSGHYTAVAKHPESQEWNLFDDEYAGKANLEIKVDENERERVHDKSALVIVYLRRDKLSP